MSPLQRLTETFLYSEDAGRIPDLPPVLLLDTLLDTPSGIPSLQTTAPTSAWFLSVSLFPYVPLIIWSVNNNNYLAITDNADNLVNQLIKLGKG